MPSRLEIHNIGVLGCSPFIGICIFYFSICIYMFSDLIIMMKDETERYIINRIHSYTCI